jgi:hypothetical protein
VSLETGSTEEFAAARALYASSGFSPCAPFAEYRASDWNTFMSLELTGASDSSAVAEVAVATKLAALSAPVTELRQRRQNA